MRALFHLAKMQSTITSAATPLTLGAVKNLGKIPGRRTAYQPPSLGYQPRVSRHPAGGVGMSGLWDDIVSVSTTYTTGAVEKLTGNYREQFASQITGSINKINQKLAVFNATGQVLIDLRTRAIAQQNSSNSDVKSRAGAITNKANALLTQYASLKAAAQNELNELAGLKNQLSTNAIFQFANPATMGTRVVELFNQYKEQLASAAVKSASLVDQMDQHMKDVNALKSDVSSLENYAAGKGWQATVGSIGTNLLGSATHALTPALAVGAGIFAIYLLAPSFLGRMARQ